MKNVKNNLAAVNSNLATEWHPTKNGELLPTQVSEFSHKKVWWICSKGHEWEATVASRSNGNNCPVCAGQKILTGYNDLATANPKLAAEWHPTKNGELLPTQVSEFSRKKVWWICSKGHEWEAIIGSRSNGIGCPVCSNFKVLSGCNDLVTTHPELAAEWHPTKNGQLTPATVIAGSEKKVWWLGKCGHEWEARIASRKHGTGCPYCFGRFAIPGKTDLLTVNPKLAAEWHPTKNGELTPSQVTAFSNKKVWWQCSKGHEWQTRIEHRSNGVGCPYCNKRGRKSKTNTL